MTCNNCNPCNECESSCKECCNPNIQWWGCVEVDVSEEGVIKISAPCPTEVTSDDWTVTVVQKEPHEGYSRRFDLSVPDNDKKVWACEWDTNPWSLWEKLETEWAIKKSLVNCPWNWKVKLRIDEDELNIPNNQVAVSAWCTPWYLRDVLISNSKYVELVETSWCRLAIRDKEWGIVCWKITMQDNVKWSVAWWWSDWTTYYIAWSEWQWLKRWVFAVDFLYNMELADNDNGLKIAQDWIYEVWFRCSLEASFWIHAVRWWLYVLRKDGWYQVICESRFSGPVWVPPFELWHWQEWFNALYMNEWTETSWVNWQSASLWAVLDRMPCEWTTRVVLHKWDILFLGMKWQARTQYTSWETISWDAIWWEIAMLWAVGNQAWDDIWAQIWADLRYYL